MKITPDTNILVRAVTLDHPIQGGLAQKEISAAELLAITLPALCELCWVLSGNYGFTKLEIAEAIRILIEADNVVADRITVEAGLALLEAGGDFADGVIAQSGRAMGAEMFVTFDRKAATLLRARGAAARIPA